jgi:PITH domain
MNCCSECACGDAAPTKSLYTSVDHERVSAVNEARRGSCAEVLRKTYEERLSPPAAESKSSSGLLVKIPFKFKVSITRIDFRGDFDTAELYANNPYVKIGGEARPTSTFALPETSSGHIIPLSLQPFLYKSVEILSVRLTRKVGLGRLEYFGITGVVVANLLKPVNASYEVYPVAKSPQETENRLHAHIAK